jgi:N-acetylneuraminate synthase
MTGKKIIIVSSISNIENISKIKFYKQCKKIQNKFNSNEYLLTFQILPPFAWYFGGSYLMNSFSKLEDLRLILSLNLKITLDLSHLIMSSNYYNFNIFNSIKLLKPITENIHLSFASRFDSEGEGFESLNKKNKLILKNILRMPQSKVLEVWQGHLNNYDGFFASFNALDKYCK